MNIPRKTKIICTIGPASNQLDNLIKLINAGMDVARLNFSHGKHEVHQETVENIRKASGITGKEIAIMQDLQGPKIRTEIVENNAVELIDGQEFVITTNEIPIGNSKIVQTSYKELPNEVKPGCQILVDDGYLILEVLRINLNDIICKVIKGGILKNRKGIIAPGVSFSAPPLSEKDIEDLQFGLSLGIDYVALSFVKNARDIIELKTSMRLFKRSVPVIAKIERPEAIANLDEILNETDAVMVARGDLGLEFPAEQVPVLQKDIIKKCNQKGITVITATQMLESMINNPRPTRAEASDVANAVYDGTDCVMLSGETSVGTYPVESVENMVRIVKTVEDKIYNIPFGDRLYTNLESNISDSLAHASCAMAEQLNARAIAALTSSSNTARSIAKFRPRIPVIGITDDINIARRMTMIWGIIPMFIEKIETIIEITEKLKENAILKTLENSNNYVVFVSGFNNAISENVIKVIKI